MGRRGIERGFPSLLLSVTVEGIVECRFQPEQFMNFDFESLQRVTEFAGELGSATGKIAKGVETVKTFLQKSESGADLEVKSALSQLALEVTTAQLANMELKLQLAALQNELTEANAFQSDLDRYELWEAPAGSVVYRLRESASQGQPLHYLCPACIERKTKAILQGHADWKECPACKIGYRINADKGPGTVRVSRGIWDDL